MFTGDCGEGMNEGRGAMADPKSTSSSSVQDTGEP
jgi:hypothetical protein